MTQKAQATLYGVAVEVLNLHDDDIDGALIEVPRRGELVEFKPERHRLTVAALDYGIEEAKRIQGLAET